MTVSVVPALSSTGGKSFLPSIDETSGTSKSVRELNGDAAVIRAQAGDLHSTSTSLHHRTRDYALSLSRNDWGRKSPADLLAHLSELGFAWRDIARMVGVSVPAIQKWRRGERITGDNRARLTQLLAVLQMVTDEYLISDPASWFEMPIVDGVAVTPIDLYVAGSVELLLDWASHYEVDSTVVLDKFDADWRQTHVDKNFEIFVAEDGELSIRPRHLS